MTQELLPAFPSLVSISLPQPEEEAWIQHIGHLVESGAQNHSSFKAKGGRGDDLAQSSYFMEEETQT